MKVAVRLLIPEGVVVSMARGLALHCEVSVGGAEDEVPPGYAIIRPDGKGGLEAVTADELVKLKPFQKRELVLPGGVQ